MTSPPRAARQRSALVHWKVPSAALLAFAFCWAAGAALSGCGPVCDCPRAPAHPDPQVLSLTGGVDYGSDDNQSIHPIDFSEGTMTVEKSRVVIEYTEDDLSYRVIYVQE